MALKAVHVSDVPCINHVPDSPAALSPFPTGAANPLPSSFVCFLIGSTPKFVVIGHRGHGMNAIQSPDRRFRSFMENTILSFNSAATHSLDFVEFDVQVTKDDCPVIFHDDVILSVDNGTVFEKRVTEVALPEFLSYGLQREPEKVGKPLLRKSKDGTIRNWEVEADDALCTLQEAFEKDYLVHVLQTILDVVFAYANQRPIIFSSFHPDAALLVRKLQSIYPVFFLTNGGTELYYDNPAAVTKIKESKLSLLTYGKLNNVVEAVYMQHLMGIEG
ncbi:hypothetical protein MLD38_013115 [Melastoma candidum]|uniref:Uncharacterized protein n=1 Tax=Melastoma candidum TaxID=119954 RepID=A0ACB9R9N4_9MYRT|nr:hypothetical protein MLD38_013115 [Melastoma candidum]